jgi:hypothetical protein
MLGVSDTVDIDRPADDVFGALADPNVQITYDRDQFRAVEQLTPGTIGKGTRFRGRFKGMGWREFSFEEFEQNRLIEVGVRLPFGAARHRFEFSSVGDHSQLAQKIEVHPNLLGRILWPLIIRRMMEDRVRTLNGLVKRYVEGRGP